MMRIWRTAPAIILGGAILLAGKAAGEDVLQKPDKKFTPMALGMDWPVITSADDLDKHVGRLVAVRGIVGSSKIARIHGVEVQAPDELRGREAYAIGILGKFTVTEDAIRKTNEQARKSGNLVGVAQTGPGVYYTLYFDLAGKKAEARELPK
ncbi:hypothetical protein [Zavarzinella formosa]|uniref:hypothetical protein n=1 Tax=Zavarzinella formosa TaxID=360055 RepID=UPI000361A6EC|nr:hypothetical protein [Zavarzinella formosa]